MQKLAQPVKLWAAGAFFRHERPQAGRFRQFTQVDAETIGSDSPLVDAELILLLHDLLAELEVQRDGDAVEAPAASARRTPEPPISTSCAPTCARTRGTCPRRCASGST